MRGLDAFNQSNRASGGVRFFDRYGQPISRETWESLSSDTAYVQVGNDTCHIEGREITVATFWLGMAGPRSSEPPAMFRTYVDNLIPTSRCLSWAWDNEPDARSGHANILHWIAQRSAGSGSGATESSSRDAT